MSPVSKETPQKQDLGYFVHPPCISFLLLAKIRAIKVDQSALAAFVGFTEGACPKNCLAAEIIALAQFKAVFWQEMLNRNLLVAC